MGTKYKRTLALLGASMLVNPVSVFAQVADIVVNNGDVVGQQSIADGQTLIVNTGGTVTDAAGAVIDAVNGITINVDNSGRIESTVNSGIDASGSDLNLLNSGTITGDFQGVEADTITRLENSGTIITGGFDGINADTITLLQNSGTITGGFDGVEADTITRLENSGTITGGFQGVEADTIALLQNSGTITGDFDGVRAHFGNIVNSGTISGSNAIVFTRATAGDVSVINSGDILSTGGFANAIAFSGTGADTLTLNPGSRIVGTIQWDGTNDTLNMGAGLNADVTTSNAPDTNNFGSPLNARVMNRSVQADVSTFAAMDDMLASLSGGISRSVFNRIDAAIGPAGLLDTGPGFVSAYLADRQAAESIGEDAIDYDARVPVLAFWADFWAAGEAANASGPAVNTNVRNYGYNFGADWLGADGSLRGIFGGISQGDIDVAVNRGQTTDTDTFYGGAYARYQPGSLGFDQTFDFSLIAGQIDFDHERAVANNAVAGGIEIARAGYDGWFINPTMRLTDETGFLGGPATPSLELGYAGLFVDGYTETGVTNPVTAGDRDIHLLTARGELSWTRYTPDESGLDIFLTPYVGAEGQFAFGDVDQVNASLLGNQVSFDPGGDTSEGSVFAGLKFSRDLSSTITTFGGAEMATGTNKSYELQANIGIVAKF